MPLAINHNLYGEKKSETTVMIYKHKNESQ